MNYVAIDLGAESGRVIRGALEDSKITLEEIHRFPNAPIRTLSSIHWDIAKIWTEVQLGLTAIPDIDIAGISVDSWGVDYVLLDSNGQMIEPTHHYRDPRTAPAVDIFLSRIPWRKVFEETGIQFMPINTLFQLASEPSARLESAKRLLGIADAFNHWIGGDPCIEESFASTFQLYDPRKRDWSDLLLGELNIPKQMLGRVVPSGTVIGEIDPKLGTDSLAKAKVIATCSHDTGAAVAAVPAQPNTQWAYLSSGTWSLMGVERSEPVINDLARDLNFTNEIGYGGSIRLLKNISGLWLLQECRRAWGQYEYSELTNMAANESCFRSIINPADQRFLAPPNMPEAIAAFCRETDQAVPQTPAAFTRCILESLALLYRHTLEQLQKLTGQDIEVLHIVGGGSRNLLLNQFTANACQIEVLAGPVEATALGNVMIQALTLGEVPDLPTARALIRQNFEMSHYEPKNPALWTEAYARFEKFLSSC